MSAAGRLLALSLLALSACTGEASYTLRISFPDEASRQETTGLHLWALGPDAGTCDALMQDGFDPEDAPVTVYASTVLPNPPGGPETLPGVPNGVVNFLVEGRTTAGARILRGCERAELQDGVTLDVRIELERVCTPAPDGQEIPGNRKDDDCDGLTDECASDLACNDRDPCTMDLCLNEECHHPPREYCDDGNPCTLNDRCQEESGGLACLGTPSDCSAYDGTCVRGVCDPGSGECVTGPVQDGEPCDDGQYCTVDDACQAGVCAGGTRDCEEGDACTRDTCNEGLDTCEHTLEPIVGAEGTAMVGTCGDGQDNDCDGLTDNDDPNCQGCTIDDDCQDANPCTTDTCQDTQCANLPVQDGIPCDDGLYCTVPDSCSAGVCRGDARDCAPAGQPDPCLEYVCVEDAGDCEERPLPQGSDCDDGDWCTVGDVCSQDGACSGMDRDCDDHDPCTQDSCRPEGQCEHILQTNPGAEGPQQDPTCSNGLDDDCDGQSDYCDEDCGHVPDCAGVECGYNYCYTTWCGDCMDGETCIPWRKCMKGTWREVFPEPGGFTMGSPPGEPGRAQDELPHTVELTHPFVIWSTEVTQEYFEEIFWGDPSQNGDCGPDCPVENLTWHEAVEFCNSLSNMEGYAECYVRVDGPDYAYELAPIFASPYDCPGYRLPTEAEWEYAARAGTIESTYNGTIDAGHLGCEQPNTTLDPIAWFCGNSDGTGTAGRRQENPWGLFDMLGHVAEWCHDRYTDYSLLPQTDPVGTGSEYFVVRGGSFDDPASSCRTAARRTREYLERDPRVGFRCARTLQ